MDDATNPANEPYTYKAFISYNSADKDFAKWLHGQLEAYRLPWSVTKQLEREGKKAGRLFPIFRDREEMTAGSDLNSEIKDILRDSEYLIVVCSPYSAKSHWVGEEIKEFRRLGRGKQILTIIAGGIPNASATPGQEALECFPPALRVEVDEHGAPLGPTTEPIAADARPEGDGRNNAKLKIIAGVIGVQFDALRRRDEEARRARLIRNGLAGTGLLVAIAAIIIVFLIRQNNLTAADLFYAQAEAALSQRDYAKAEFAAAQSLSLSDTPRTRETLLQAQLGGVRFVARSPKLAGAEATTISRDGRLVATVERTGEGAPVMVTVTSMRDSKALWQIALPSSAEMPNSIALDQLRNGERQIAVAWPEQKGTKFRVGVWALRANGQIGTFRELSTRQAMQGRHSKRIPSMDFDPAQDWIATCGEDGKLVLWDLSTPNPTLIWEQEGTHDPDVHGLAFSPDGMMLGSAGGDYLAKIWSVAAMTGPNYHAGVPYRPHTLEPIETLNGHSDSVFRIAFSADGHHAATGGYDRTIRIWEFDGIDVQGPKRKPSRTIATLNGNEGTIFALAYSQDGKLLVSGASDGGVDLWDGEAGRLLNRFTPGQGIIRAVAAPSFEEGVDMAGEQGWTAFSVVGSPVLKRLWNGGATVGVTAFDPTGQLLAASGGGDNGRIRVWDRDYRLVQLLDPSDEGENVDGIAFSPDGRWVAAGGSSGLIHVWDRGTKRWTLRPSEGGELKHDGYVWGLCFDAKSTFLYSSSQSPNARIKRWDTSSWLAIGETPRLEDSVYALACDDRSGSLVAGDSRARMRLYRMSDFKQMDETTNVFQGELNVWSLSLASDVHAIASGNSDGKVWLWTPNDPAWAVKAKGKKLGTSDADAMVNPTINSVAYNAKYHWIAAGGVGPSVEIYDATTMAHLRSLRGHDGTIWWLTFDPTGTRLAYGGLDKIVRVVDVEAMLRLFSEPPATILAASQHNTGLKVRDNQISPY